MYVFKYEIEIGFKHDNNIGMFLFFFVFNFKNAVKFVQSTQKLYDRLLSSSTRETIRKLLNNQKRWFPDLVEYYPRCLYFSIKQIKQSLQSTMRMDVLNIIIDCFCNVELFAN